MTTTPITKEALIELGFVRDYPNEYKIQNRNSYIKVYFHIGSEKHFAVVGDLAEQESAELRNLKTIEQLKTIIEVCL